MSRSWSGHYIETIKGEDYIRYNDYLEVETERDDYKKVINKIKEYVKEQYIPGSIIQNNSINSILLYIDKITEEVKHEKH